jgi:HSP20 family molecular chaperone IbpA
MFNILEPDGMYIPDNNLPRNCYIEFPTWQHPHYSPKTPKNWDWIPAVPPYRSYEDKPLDGLSTLAKYLQTNQHFSQTKDTLKFRLELAGFGKEHVSVSIEDGKSLKVSAKNNMLSYNNSFPIPNPEKYNLSNPTAQMTNGLLEIFFAAKKEEVRAIKIL